MKLAGLKVADMSLGFPGPMLAGLMADHGADVIKVEPPGGDFIRNADPGVFGTLNRGKRSIVLDLKSPDDRPLLDRIAGWADVMVESFRTGAAERLGFGYEAMSACNPRLVYCSVTGFGSSGPLSGLPAHDIAVQAYAGSVPFSEDGRAVRPENVASTVTAALAGLSGVLMAVLRARDTGVGDHVDVSMLDCMLHAQLHRLESTPRPPAAVPALLDMYETADGRWVVLGGREPKFARALLEGVGRSDLVAPALCSQPGQQALVREALRDVFRTRPRDHWTDWAVSRGVSLAPVLSFPEALAHPQVQARSMLLEGADGERQLASPIHFQRDPARPGTRVPDLSGDAAGILASLGAGDMWLSGRNVEGTSHA